MNDSPFANVHDSAGLKEEQAKSLASTRRPYGPLARMLFLVMDLLYGRKRCLEKCLVLEIIARVPYQAWEHVAYIALTHTSAQPHLARRVFEFVVQARQQQDNEQWHMFILEEMLTQRGMQRGLIKFFLLPQIMAFVYYHLSWLLYVVKPSLSYALNADFEDHAEHEYMQLVRENPQFETEQWVSDVKADYGNYQTVADLFRRIGLDERIHKEESVTQMRHPRFS